METISDEVSRLYANECEKLLFLGGDHSISYPILRAVSNNFANNGKGVVLIHFDSHFDTWNSYFGQKCTHGTPFKRALEEGLIDVEHSMHVGIRGSVNSFQDVADDAELGFSTVFCEEVDDHPQGIDGITEKILSRVRGSCAEDYDPTRPVYVSIDIDVVDPAFAPGTGTPEPGGLSSREILRLLRGLKELNVVGGDIVEVAPCYDNGNVTSQLAASLCYELLCLLAPAAQGK